MAFALALPGLGGACGSAAHSDEHPGEKADSAETPLNPQSEACQLDGREYAGNADECEKLQLSCEGDSHPFRDQCGCGCFTVPDFCKRDDRPRRYETFGLNSCTGVDVHCAADELAFDDSRCGCGCEPKPEGWDDYCDVAGRDYARDTAFDCRDFSPSCPEGSAPFGDECGCGCFTFPESCKTATRRYVTEGRGSCAGAVFGCDEGETVFEDDCGCGCEAAL